LVALDGAGARPAKRLGGEFPFRINHLNPFGTFLPEASRMRSHRRGHHDSHVIVHLIDGTYELFRHFYGLRRFNKGQDKPYAAVAGVLGTVLQMVEEGATHLGVATDHVIDSFRNDLWGGYKTGDGVDPALRAQFHPLEDALAAMGVAVWPMIELEADDGLASAASLASTDERAQKVCIWTPDKDLAQCVQADRVVQVDRKSKAIRDAAGVRAKFGVGPELIPDYLALVGDSADGYPGIAGIGPKGAATMLLRHGRVEDFPAEVLGERRELALLFKKLATLRTDATVFADVDELQWRGPTAMFAAWSAKFGNDRLLARASQLSDSKEPQCPTL
jgi:5'-3' exonuclease